MLVNILILMVTLKQMSKPEGPTHINNSALEPVLFEKLHNIKLSQSVFRVTTFFQFESTKVALEILLQYMHCFGENLKTLYLKLATDNELDHKSYDVRQCLLTYWALLKLYTDELMDCKSHIAQLTTQDNNIFSTLDQTSPKPAKRGIIQSLAYILFGDANSSADINTIKI